MKERPILFSAPMVRAILDGRKTQTRRVVMPLGAHHLFRFIDIADMPTGKWAWCSSSHVVSKHIRCPFGQPGDRLWVREAWRIADSDMCGCGEDYCCTCGCNDQPIYAASVAEGTKDYYSPWRPSIHMPRWASRITLEITGVRVERLQSITGEDALAEGVQKSIGGMWCGAPHKAHGAPRQHNSAREAFADLWQSLNAKRPGCSWDDNPWVWVVEFRRVKGEASL